MWCEGDSWLVRLWSMLGREVDGDGCIGCIRHSASGFGREVCSSSRACGWWLCEDLGG